MKKLIAFVLGLFITLPAMSAGLPSGYTEVEYIQSSGTQYIDTGVIASNNMKAEIRGNFLSVDTTSAHLLSARKGSSGYNSLIAWNNNNSGGYFTQFAGGAGYTRVVMPKDTNIHVLQAIVTPTSTTTSVDSSTDTMSVENIGQSLSLYINARNVDGTSVADVATYRYYYVKIWKNDILVADFVPVKKTVNGTDVYGMYNVLDSNPETAFYGNKGTGEFTGGPDVVQPNCNMFNEQSTLNKRYPCAVAGSYPSVPSPLDPNSRTYFMTVKPNTTYTISMSTAGDRLFVFGINSIINPDDYTNENRFTFDRTILGYSANTGTVPTTATFTTNSTEKMIAVYYALSTLPTNFKIEEGSTATPYTPYDASCHTSANTCNNIWNQETATQGRLIFARDGGLSSNTFDGAYYDTIPVTPGKVYTISASLTTGWTSAYGFAWLNSDNGYISGEVFTGDVQSATAPANAAYIKLGIMTTRQPDFQLCESSPIKIATTKYNNTAFSGVVTALNNAVDTIKTVVANTINQATAVANLHSGKQTKPTDTCPNGKICLLVEDESGTPHWYEIIERAPGIVPAGSGYTQVEYLQSDGNQCIDTGINIGIDKQTDVRFGVTEGSYSRFGFVIGGASHYQGLVTRTIANTYYSSLYSSSDNTWTFDNANSVFDFSFNTAGHKVLLNGIQPANTVGNHATTLVPKDPYDTTNHIGIFCTPTSSSNRGIGRVYRFAIRNNTTDALLFDGVPARRDSDGVLGMYDTVSGNFFTNAGTGEFTAPTTSRLPSGYTELQYIQSDGGAYIDTGMVVPTNYKWELKLNTRGSNTSPYWGYTNNNSYSSATSFYSLGANGQSGISGITISVGAFSGTSESNQSSFYNATQIANAGTLGGDAMHTIKCNGNFNFTADDTPMTQMTAKTFTAFTPGGNAYLFARNAPTMNSGAMAKSGTRIYSYKVWNASGTLVQDLVPVQQGTSIGMYDLVENQFLRKLGTGEFTAGPAVQ